MIVRWWPARTKQNNERTCTRRHVPTCCTCVTLPNVGNSKNGKPTCRLGSDSVARSWIPSSVRLFTTGNSKQSHYFHATSSHFRKCALLLSGGLSRGPQGDNSVSTSGGCCSRASHGGAKRLKIAQVAMHPGHLCCLTAYTCLISAYRFDVLTPSV